ncbi:hypothetical protein KDH_74530 [Dictyobacter sp. S3.2.2.5]|uniref:Uncharacterized protein n=2 Tax=Dictyobacter halimunensis TaxID=3026934 RepID=A0ABQ6G276_9CHLR|nr:hypothetical protein KDH_74530 [Dictyobacter sp. S3.2.2.5]
MKAIHSISLIGRLALMAALVLGLILWIMQIGAISVHISSVLNTILRDIHQLLGVSGAILLIALGVVAMLRPGARSWAAAGILYAFVFPAFGLLQETLLLGGLHWLVQIVHLLLGIGAMYLAREIERRYQRLIQDVEGGIVPVATATPPLGSQRATN